MADFALLQIQSPKLISRKIWVIEKSWNFHTVGNRHFMLRCLLLGVGRELSRLDFSTFSCENLISFPSRLEIFKKLKIWNCLDLHPRKYSNSRLVSMCIQESIQILDLSQSGSSISRLVSSRQNSVLTH